MILRERLDAPARRWPWACLNWEMCFWPAKTRKNIELLEMRTCHWTGAQMRFRHNSKKLVRPFLSHLCTDRYSCLCVRNEFSSAVFQVLDWKFLLLHFEGNVCNWIPKVNWPWMKWFRVFLLQNGLFDWLHISIESNLQELLFFHLFCRHQNLFMFRLMGVYSGLFFENACAFYPQDFVTSMDKL